MYPHFGQAHLGVEISWRSRESLLPRQRRSARFRFSHKGVRCFLWDGNSCDGSGLRIGRWSVDSQHVLGAKRGGTWVCIFRFLRRAEFLSADGRAFASRRVGIGQASFFRRGGVADTNSFLGVEKKSRLKLHGPIWLVAQR